jgi:hypothetical protein
VKRLQWRIFKKKNIDDWKISKVQKNQIYQTSSFNLFKTVFTIKIKKKRDIQLIKSFETIQLLSQESLQKHIDRNFKYIHIGLVQSRNKTIYQEGLNTSILVVLRYARF